MEQIIEYINMHAHLAPYIIFGMLMLAGFNVPVSEDGMLLISALLAAKNPELTVQLFLGVYLGAYLSDLVAYWLGRLLGPKLWEIKFFANMVSKERITDISKFYDKYGMITLIIGRFIPFGVRNALFITAGLGKMRFPKFMFSDWIACTISTVSFFTLYYKVGPSVVEYVKKGNTIFFFVVLAVVTSIVFISKRKKK